MKHLLIVLLFLLIPGASSAITTFTQFGDPDILYNGTMEELVSYHQKVMAEMETAQKDNNLTRIAALSHQECKVLIAMGFYEQARTMGQISVQSYEALLDISASKSNTNLLLAYVYALCNLAEVSTMLYTDDNEVVSLHSKAVDAIRQWMLTQKNASKDLDYETAVGLVYSGITSNQLLVSSAFISRDYLGCIQHVEEEIKEIEEMYEGLEMEAHKSIEYIMALQFYAKIYGQIEDYEQALRYWKESLDIIGEVYGKQSRLYATTLREIGTVYYSLFDIETSSDYFGKSVQTYSAAGFGQSAELGELMNLGGMLLFLTGDFAGSEDMFKQGNAVFAATCGKNSFPTKVNKAMSFYPLLCTNQNKKAKKLLAELLADPVFYRNTSGDHVLKACVYSLEMELKDKKYKDVYSSKEDVEKYIDLMQNTTKGVLKQYYITMGRAYQGDNKMMEACPYFNQALTLLRDVARQNFAFLSEKQRSMFWLFDEGRIGSIMAQNRSKQEGGNAIGALLYDAALLQKGLLLEASVNLARIVEEKGTPALKQKMRHLQMMMQGNLTAEQRRECQTLETEVQNEARKYGDFLNYTDVVWTDVQKVLDDHSVAVEFVCSTTDDGKQHYSAEVLRKGMASPFHLNLFTVEKDELTCGAGKGTFNDFAIKNIWPERMLEQFHPGDHIYFSPSGALHMLPIEYMTMANGQRMDETYQMHRLSSTRELVRKASSDSTPVPPNRVMSLNRNMGLASRPQKTITLFGGFNFNASDDDMDLAMANSTVDTTRGRSKSQSQGISYWNNLPGTLNEVKSIVPIMTKARYKVVLNTQNRGTEALFKQESGKHTDIIHIATHGYYLEGKANDLNKSGLIFSGGNNHWAALKENPKGSQMDDGILTAEEIAHLNLIGTNLTVLSACQTGLGEVTGEGVFGLQRSFKKAGVQSLLMSLWEVDDEATQLLMTAFYTHYAQGQTKREALKAAQQEVRRHQFVRDGKDISGSDPYFWASFILVDE